MIGLAIFIIIFGLMDFLAGLYLFTGHKSELLLWKVHNVKKMTLNEVKKIGSWTMIIGLTIVIVGIILLFI